MSESFAFIDIIFFAMVAAFIAFRLRSVLGRRTGNERRRTNPFMTPKEKSAEAQASDNVVKLPDRPASLEGGEPSFADIHDPALKQGLTEIRLADPHFDLDGFLQGARAAFAMIIESFAKGDKQALQPLLGDTVYASFAAAIDAREAAGETLTSEIVSFRSVDIAEAGMQNSHSRLAVRFVTEQINATTDADGNVVDGDPAHVAEVVDLWTFSRDTRTSDPNWQLVETRTPD